MLFKRLSLSIILALFFVIEAQSAVISNAIKPVPYFSGRASELKQIDKIFNSGEGIVSVVGISGIGKTELTRKYVSRRQEAYNIIWFFDVKADLRIQFQLLARQLNLMYGKKKALILDDLDSCIESVMLYIRDKNKWLFVFDNLAIGENNKITEFIGQNHNGHIIVTSQDRGNLQNVVHLDFLNYEISKEIIKKVLKNATNDQMQRIYDDLHGYPLLLVQYSYFMRDNLDASLALLKDENDDYLIALMQKFIGILDIDTLKLLVKISSLNNNLLEKDFLLLIGEDSRNIFYLNRVNLITVSHTIHNTKRVVFAMHNLIKEKLLNIANLELVKSSILELIDQTTSVFPKSEHLYGNILKEYPGLLSNLEFLLENAEKNEIDITKILELRKVLLISYFYLLDYAKTYEMLVWFKGHKTALTKDKKYTKQKAEALVVFLIIDATYKKFTENDFSESGAMSNFEEAIKIISNNDIDHLKCYVYEEYAQTLAHSGDVNKAFEKIEVARGESLHKTDLEIDKGTLYFTLAKIYLEKGEYELSLKYIRQSQEVEKQLGDSPFSEPSYELEAAILLRKGDYKKAYQIAKGVRKRVDSYFDDDHELKARALIVLSWSEAGSGRIVDAEKNIKVAKQFFNSKDNEDIGRVEYPAYISIVEGEIALKKKEHQKALDFYIEAANNLKKIYHNNLKNDFYGYILERIVISAKLADRKVHMRHYMLEHQEIFGKFSSRSRRIDALF